MKTTLKVLALVASFSVLAGSAFADNTDVSTLSDMTQAYADRATAIAGFGAALDLTGSESMALINQDTSSGSGTTNASIDQSGTGTGNFAAINQTGGFSALAMITQVGSNFAMISQDSTMQSVTSSVVQNGVGNKATVNQH